MLKSVNTGLVRPTSGMMRRQSLIVRADNNNGKVTREYREDTGEVTTNNYDSSNLTPGSAPSSTEPLFVDPDAPVVRKKPISNLSKEMKSKIRDEYLGFGGSSEKATSSNFFLNICLGIAFLAVLSKLTGTINF